MGEQKRSPLAPASFPTMPPLAGVELATGACGIRYQGRTDVLMVSMAPGTTAAGVYTRSLTRSAPVDWCKQCSDQGRGRVVVVNSGNANAFTGQAGIDSVRRTVDKAAALMGCAASEVYISSTGTIGVTLPDDKITAHLEQLKAGLRADAWFEAAQAIMTTDTFPKGATRIAHIGEHKVRISGIAKGSGMIAPDMATMLAYVFTDATLPHDVLQSLLDQGVKRSFNCITVDSDTSTSDTLLLFATGQVKHDPITSPTDPLLRDFKRKLFSLLLDMAQQVVCDGEGATKFAEIRVNGAAGNKAAHRIAMSIANSPLVKTALAGEDANWGRVVAAVGKSGEKADRDRLCIRMGGIEVARNGQVVPDYDETPVTRHMQGKNIRIEVDLGLGRGKAIVWTCDLTHGYIDINGSYRT